MFKFYIIIEYCDGEFNCRTEVLIPDMTGYTTEWSLTTISHSNIPTSEGEENSARDHIKIVCLDDFTIRVNRSHRASDNIGYITIDNW